MAGTYSAGNTVAVTVNDVPPTIALTGSSPTDPTGATIHEGSSYPLTLGAITDPGIHDTILSYTIAWGDSTFQTSSSPIPSGANPVNLTHVYADGPNNYTIRVTLVTTDGTFSNAGTKPVTVQNVAPTAVLSNLGGDVDQGQAGYVGFSNQYDPSVPDTNAGFHYAFDFNDDGIFDSGQRHLCRQRNFSDRRRTGKLPVDPGDAYHPWSDHRPEQRVHRLLHDDHCGRRAQVRSICLPQLPRA